MSWKNKQLKEAYAKYPELQNKLRLANALIDYNNIKARYPFGDLDKKYRSMTFNPNNNHKNDIRHIYTNAMFMQKYPEDFVRELGNFKEDADLIDFKPIADTFGDYINNEKGINIGKKYPFAPSDIIFNNVLEEINLPITPRNNTLYGYILERKEQE